jgi:hypothetical protein
MNQLNEEYRHILKVHNDVITLPEIMNQIYKEYEELGYKMHLKLPGSFSYYLDDGTAIIVYWEKGIIYENAVVEEDKRIAKVNALEQDKEVLKGHIDENSLIDDYKELLNTRYESFKSFLLQENFVPDANEVWKMYSRAFNENSGIYHFAVKLLNLELFDKNGRLNECHIYLDKVNEKLINLCSGYVMNIIPQQMNDNVMSDLNEDLVR